MIPDKKAQILLWVVLTILALIPIRAVTEEAPNSGVKNAISQLSSEGVWERNRGINFLVETGSKAVPALIIALNDTNKNTRESAATALGQIGPSALPSLMLLLETSDDTTTITIVKAIGEIGELAAPAVPTLIEIMRTTTPEIQRVTASALGNIGRPSVAAIPQLIEALNSKNADLRAAAANAAGNIGSGSPIVVEALVKMLRSEGFEGRIAAARALGQIGPKAKAAVPALGEALRNKNDSSRIDRTVITFSLFEIGTTALPELIASMDDPTAEVREMAAIGLQNYGPEGASALPVLIRTLLHDPILAVRQNSVTAISGKGIAAQEAIPTLLKMLDEQDEWLSKVAAENLVEIAQVFSSQAGKMSPLQLERALTDIEKMQDAIGRADLAKHDSSSPFNSPKALANLEKSYRILQGNQFSRRSWLFVQIATAFSVTLFLIVIISFSTHIRRGILLRMGRRWRFSPGSCKWTGEIKSDRLIIKDNHNAGPVVIGAALTQWPLDEQTLFRVRQSLTSGSDLQLIIEEDQFRYPWAHVLGGDWSLGPEAVIAGQIGVVSETASPAISRGDRKLVFGGIVCREGVDLNPLHSVKEEMQVTEDCFRRWGATLLPLDQNTTIAVALKILTTADIVHVAAHASPAGIHLADGVLDHTRLDDRLLSQIRCRLLVLSACSAGRLREETTLVSRLLGAGVNVLAALEPVRDHTCFVFFQEFYNALLPAKLAEGIKLSSAIRKAVNKCAVRCSAAEVEILPIAARGQWRNSVDSFILYGDPSMHLRLS